MDNKRSCEVFRRSIGSATGWHLDTVANVPHRDGRHTIHNESLHTSRAGTAENMEEIWRQNNLETPSHSVAILNR